MVSFRDTERSVLDWAGQTVSHYRVLRKLGGGGMGVVYEAEDVRLRRHVALKFLPETLAHNHEALQRFQREARAASSLNHPNICTIHEIEEHEGQPVIVMELVQGSMLKERMAEGPLPLPTILDLAIDICEGLEAAHSEGIVHRDIKPSNIFVTTRGRAKILDFGLAKLLPHPTLESEVDGGSVSDQSLTIPGVIRGTTSYMSPEQARGDELDRRTDLFSLGIVLYEMCTGQQPFARKNIVLTVDAVLNAKPIAASKLNSAVPAELEAVIAKALEKNRERRYQSGAEMAADLQRVRQAVQSIALSRGAAYNHAEAQHSPGALAAKPARVITSDTPLFGITRHWKVIVPSVLVLVIVLGSVLFFRKSATSLTEKDTIVLADFENNTGDPVFDDTLKQALAVDLGQSPFLNILSDRRMTATLRLMGRFPEQPVVGEIARDLCQRVGSKAVLAGSISALGNNYVIGLNALNCATGEVLVKQQIEAHGKEDVLKALGTSAIDMRRKLGESLASVQKFATPIEEATTSSLEALKAYSMGRRAGYAKGDIAALPYHQRAVELDSKFALAYRAMAAAYTNLGQGTRARENARRAFELRDRVSERERYAIESYYYSVGTGALEKGNQVYELWKQSYPRDFLPLLNLGDNYMRLGQWTKAQRETQQSLRLEPNSSVTISNLAWIQLELGRPDEARKTIDQAIGRGIDTQPLRVALYQTGFIRGEQDVMEQQLAWAAGRAGQEDWLLSTQADTEAYHGRLSRARELSRRAAQSALQADAKETAALWYATAGLREADFGNPQAARQNIREALRLLPGVEVQCMAALALARAGDVAGARKLIGNLTSGYPQHSIVHGYWLPSVLAAIELYSDHAAAAIEALESATAFELAQNEPITLGMMYPAYLRGQAHLLAGRGQQGAAEFQKIIDHSGLVLNFPIGALARLNLARAYGQQGDTAKARTAYEEFLNIWKDADRDVLILRQAQAEYAKLK